MHEATVMQLAGQTMMLVAKLAGPLLGVSLAVGLLVSLFQAATQVQEYTLTFVPKLVAVSLVLLISGHWMLGEVVHFTDALFASIPHMVGGG